MSRRREERGGKIVRNWTSESSGDEISVAEAIEDWLSTKATTTQTTYRSVLAPFLTHLHQTYGRQAFTARRKHLINFYNTCLKPKKLISERRTYCVLRSFYQHLFTQRLISSDPTRSIPVPKKQQRSIPRALTKEQVQLLLTRSSQKKFSRVKPMLWCSLYAGLRKFEIRMLKKSHLRKITTGARPRYEIFVARGKGGRSRTVRIDGKVYRELLKQKKKHQDSAWMFPNARGKPYSLSTLHRRFKALFKSCGLGDHSTHSGRHAFCSHSLENGASLSSVSKSMGHSSVATTSLYLHDISEKPPCSYMPF